MEEGLQLTGKKAVPSAPRPKKKDKRKNAAPPPPGGSKRRAGKIKKGKKR
jgi:hypothetical protein